MSLNPGTKLGPYEILAPLGAGGMGEVYRASDSKLKRDVAIKVLPEGFAKDPDRMKRFEREAQVLASLNHPNIAAIYGLEENALVLELVEGPTLAERIRQGDLPLEEAVAIARQVAEGLEAAHEKGIIHRDLKPANVKLTANGDVKILDFGLAKALEGEAPDAENSNSPTMTRAATAAGVLLGTAAYMSPEQARGKAIDKRADIWAFGCVLYEMLTGRRLFDGETVSDTLASVLTREPDWSALPDDMPAPVRRALARCLERDVKNRFHDIADVRIEISGPLGTSASDTAPTVKPITRPRLALALLAAVVAGGVGGWLFWSSRPAPHAPVYRFTIEDVASRSVAISPDGRWLVYRRESSSGEGQPLYVRGLDEVNGRPIPGTEVFRYPFFSPDGSRIGLFQESGGRRLAWVSLTGGVPQPIPESEAYRLRFSDRGVWLPDETIVFSSEGGDTDGLRRLSLAGGTPSVLTKTAVDETHLWPEAVPGGKAVLYTVVQTNGRFRIEAVSLESGERQLVADGAAYPRVSPATGQLLFWKPPVPTLLAAPFDAARLELTGPAVPVVSPVAATTDSGEMQFSLSSNGTLAYRPGTGDPDAENASPFIVEPDGEASLVFDQRDSWSEPRLSPDGQQLLIRQEGTPNCNLWLYDFSRSTLTRVTLEADNHNPLWMPDGKSVVFLRQHEGAQDVMWQPADGSGEARALVEEDDGVMGLQSVSPDGGALLLRRQGGETGSDLWVVPLDGSGESRPFLRTDFAEAQAVFSPDGRFVAYMSDVSGRNEVYVRPYPGPGPVQQLSIDGGEQPRWSRDGSRLFYVSGHRLMSVATRLAPEFSAGHPELLLEGTYDLADRGAIGNYDVFPDGQRFLMMKSAMSDAELGTLHILINWPDVLRRASIAGQ